MSLDYEYRDFEFIIPSTDFTASRQLFFDADGFGVSARIATSDRTSLRLRAIKYDYSVPFRPVENTDAARLLTVSRLSLINSLVDHRASLALGIERGDTAWDIDLMIVPGRNRSLSHGLMHAEHGVNVAMTMSYEEVGHQRYSIWEVFFLR